MRGEAWETTTGARLSSSSKVWTCEHCGERNVTRRTDVFSDQCRACAGYNDLDWRERADLSLAEARAALETEGDCGQE